MPPRLLVLSRDAAEAYEPVRREVCISIGDPLHLPVALSPKFTAVLRLNFSDITEDIPHPTYRRFATHDAQQIIEFIARWRDVDQIVVHCRAGLSRSPGVAMGIRELQGSLVDVAGEPYPLANTWVRDLVVKIGNEIAWPIGKSLPRSDDPLDALRNPSRLWARCEVMSKPSPVPAFPGLHAWFFREVPPEVPAEDAIVQHGFTLLYIGIAPPREGSSNTLRIRIRQHFSGTAFGSPLRLALGCLLAKELGMELRSVGASRRLTFGSGEERLSEWMAANAFVAWVEHPRPWEIERDVIADLRPPLNLEGNSAHPFCAELSGITSEMKRRAMEPSR
jgi:hypothetical protein